MVEIPPDGVEELQPGLYSDFLHAKHVLQPIKLSSDPLNKKKIQTWLYFLAEGSLKTGRKVGGITHKDRNF